MKPPSAFYRWLKNKYPSIFSKCVEEKPFGTFEVEPTRPNPKKVEFDNLYLDMNAIIHDCCSTISDMPSTGENDIISGVLMVVQRIVDIVKPRRLLYLSMDGVAPMAKMDKQRSRRFLNSIAKESNPQFDINSISPGTEFMFSLSKWLRCMIKLKMSKDMGWRDMMVILSDSNVPGEGEHKIMDFIRQQRAQPDHDPNTRHCLYGADADLVTLGLASQEPNFTIMREEFEHRWPSEKCGGKTHDYSKCPGRDNWGDYYHEELTPTTKLEQDFIFVSLNVLRECLQRELTVPGLEFKQDLERSVDDWVLICSLVKNDFLPQIPSLEIREGAIDRLTSLYKEFVVKKSKGYLIDGGVDLRRLLLLMGEFGKTESSIFKNRRMNEMKHKFANPETDSSEDKIRLWEDGYKSRYYAAKFGTLFLDDAIVQDVLINEYLRGICWMVRYYFQGCPSWTWCYGFRYAPLAVDFINGSMNIVRTFSTGPDGSKPLRPLEHLMRVLPAASKCLVPSSWQHLMGEHSDIEYLYPTECTIDLNGKRHPWQGVFHLPYFNDDKLMDALTEVYWKLTEEERNRNQVGSDILFVHRVHGSMRSIMHLYERTDDAKVALDATVTGGIAGFIFRDEDVVWLGDVFKCQDTMLEDYLRNNTMSVEFSHDYRNRSRDDGKIYEKPKLNVEDYIRKYIQRREAIEV